jgi:ketopantoate reductase
MRFIIVGAGAVGAVIGTLLQSAGHDVHFWLRPRLRAQLSAIEVERLNSARVAIAPRCLSVGETVPASDWVLVCVRGEQLDEALRDVVHNMGAERRVAVAAVSLSGVIEQARAAGLSGGVFALHVSFGSYTAEARASTPAQNLAFMWFPFVAPSTVTPDRERAHMPEARALARALAQAGLPTRAVLSMNAAMRFLVATNSVLALGWDLCDWELAQLAKHAVLRRETAAAMHEAVRLAVPARSPFLLLPRVCFDLFLRAFPWLMSKRGRAVWLRHGPKIRAQTDYVVRALLARGLAQQAQITALQSLFARWRAAVEVSDPAQPLSASRSL